MIYPDECKIQENLIFDTHSHYDDSRFDGLRDKLLSEMHNSGVANIITCAVDGFSAKKALSLAEKYNFIYAAVGIHPENLKSKTTIDEIKRLSAHKKCVAIGEIGLDYYYTQDNNEEQKQVFENQVMLANELKLPVIVHDREAHADTLKILKKHKPKGVLHCFSGSAEMAKEIIKIGMYIGVGGTITFKNARKLPDVIREVPRDRILLETDCPYLCPEPYRGKLCHSGYITLTAERIAEILGTDRDSILRKTCENARKLLSL
ncbi:MAG: TatD family hydrolase [Clostridia bacterium]|nr:TatD family hydrolase [Clostridia bacterium]